VLDVIEREIDQEVRVRFPAPRCASSEATVSHIKRSLTRGKPEKISTRTTHRLHATCN
jgi:hypothetical protein